MSDVLATYLATVELPVDVGSSAAPGNGDRLTAVDATHAQWLPPAPALALALEDRAPVLIGGGATPVAGDVLTEVDGTRAAEWRAPEPAVELALVGRAPVAIVSGPTPAAGDVLTASGAEAASWLAPAPGVSPSPAQLAAMSGEMWFPPSVPHARDIEFSSEVLPADLVWANAAMTPITPLNNEALTRYSSPTSLPRYKVHTQRRPSWLQWQTPKDGAFRYLYVPFDMPVGGCVWIRATYGTPCPSISGTAQNSSSHEASLRLALLADAAGKPDVNNQMFIQFAHETTPTPPAPVNRAARGGYVQAGVETLHHGQCVFSYGHGFGTYFGIHRVNQNTYDAWVAQESGACVSLVDVATATAPGPSLWGPSTPKYIGIRFGCASGAPGGRQHVVYSLDFIRVSTSPILPW